MSLFHSAAKGVAWTTVSTFVRSLVQLLQVSILTRFIDKTDFGIVAIATLFIGFTQIFLDLGLSVGIMHKDDTTPEQYSSLFWLNIICGVALTLILCVASPLVASIYKETSLARILSLLSLSVLFSSLGSQHRTIQQKKMRFKEISIIEIIASIATLVTAFVLAYLGLGIYSLVVSTLCNALVSNMLFLVLGLFKDRNISFHFKIKETIPYLKIGVYSIGSQIIDYFSRELDIIIISATLGKDSLGVYSLCKKLVAALYSTINPIVVKVLTPMIAHIQGDINKVKEVYFSVVESLSIINFPIFCLLAIFSKGVLNIVYGSSYVDASNAFSLLALYYGYLTASNPIGCLQTALGRADTGFYWTIPRIIFYSIAIGIGAIFGIECIIVCLIIMNVAISPVAWRITVKPLIPAVFWEYFFMRMKPYFFNIVLAIPAFLLLNKVTNLFYIIIFSSVYLLIYLLLISMIMKESFVVKFLKSRMRPKRL